MIESIRQKPKPVRNAYAFGVATVFTLVIAVIWSLSIPDRVATLITTPAESTTTTPQSQLWAGVLDWGANLRAAVISAGQTGSQLQLAPTTTDFTETVSGIDINELATTTADPAPTATNTVWQREYPARSGGHVILIATTSSSSQASTTP